MIKIISGGQTGVDQLALRVAKQCNIETGGTAPCRFMTSTGPNNNLKITYGLEELKNSSSMSLSAQYIVRSKRNVDHSDATLIFNLNNSPGTNGTISYCKNKTFFTSSTSSKPHRPFFIIEPKQLMVENRSATMFDCLDFLCTNKIKTLNVAGPRSIDVRHQTQIEIFLTDLFIVWKETMK